MDTKYFVAAYVTPKPCDRFMIYMGRTTRLLITDLTKPMLIAALRSVPHFLPPRASQQKKLTLVLAVNSALASERYHDQMKEALREVLATMWEGGAMEMHEYYFDSPEGALYVTLNKVGKIKEILYLNEAETVYLLHSLRNAINILRERAENIGTEI